MATAIRSPIAMADEEPLRGFLWPFIFRSVGRRRRRIPAASGCQRNRQRGADYSRAARPRSEGCGGHGDQQHAHDQRREEGREGRGRGRLLSLGAQLWLLRPHHRAAAGDRRRQRQGKVQEGRFESDDSQEVGSAELAEKDRADRRLTCLHAARVAPPKWQPRWPAWQWNFVCLCEIADLLNGLWT